MEGSLTMHHAFLNFMLVRISHYIIAFKPPLTHKTTWFIHSVHNKRKMMQPEKTAGQRLGQLNSISIRMAYGPRRQARFVPYRFQSSYRSPLKPLAGPWQSSMKKICSNQFAHHSFNIFSLYHPLHYITQEQCNIDYHSTIAHVSRKPSKITMYHPLQYLHIFLYMINREIYYSAKSLDAFSLYHHHLLFLTFTAQLTSKQDSISVFS